MVTDSGQIAVREQWDHPYKEGSSLFRFHISVANIVQSSVSQGVVCCSREVIKPGLNSGLWTELYSRFWTAWSERVFRPNLFPSHCEHLSSL